MNAIKRLRDKYYSLNRPVRLIILTISIFIPIINMFSMVYIVYKILVKIIPKYRSLNSKLRLGILFGVFIILFIIGIANPPAEVNTPEPEPVEIEQNINDSTATEEVKVEVKEETPEEKEAKVKQEQEEARVKQEQEEARVKQEQEEARAKQEQEEARAKQEQEDRINFLKSFIDKPIPYDKFNEYGSLQTLEGTDNRYYVGYLEKINMSFISKKDNNIIFFTGEGKDSAIQEKNRLKESREKELSKQFSAWDGSHIKLNRLIKDRMNDPKSFEHVKTVYFDMKDHLIINTTFRGTNTFGGKVTNVAKGKASIDGETIELLEIIN